MVAPRQNPYLEIFSRLIVADVDDLGYVLRLHTYIEAELKALIRTLSFSKKNADAANAILDKLAFSRLVQVATELSLIDAYLAKLLNAINGLRVEFAHHLELRKLTQKDDTAFIKRIPVEELPHYETFMRSLVAEYGADSAQTGFKTRCIIFCALDILKSLQER